MIGVYTYPVPHRKTQDLIFRLLARYPDREFCLIDTPYEERKPRNPLIEHRPRNPISLTSKELADFCNIMHFTVEPKCEFYLIGGAGILDPTNKTIINGHPGYLPEVRGLDALKWAYLKGLPIGVTTHIISDRVDLGTLIDRIIIGRRSFEDFYHLAIRQYELEIQMLVDAVRIITDNMANGMNLDLFDDTPIFRRMPKEEEFKLLLKINKDFFGG